MRLSYLFKELYYRRRRTAAAVAGLSIGIALLVLINALSVAFRETGSAPLKAIGADISIQRAGDVPQELDGAVFPCSAVTIHQDEVDRIGKLPGVKGLGSAVLFWNFSPDSFAIVLGLDPENSVGPGILRNHLMAGRFFNGNEPAALAEATYAEHNHLKIGDMVTLGERKYPLIGLVDVSAAAKIAVANLYLPLSEAQKIASASPQVQAVSPFEAGDVNLLFLTADPENIKGLRDSIKQIMGPQATVATPETFLKKLGNLFALSDKFALAASIIAIVVCSLIVLKTMAGNINERAREIGILKSLGWTNHNVTAQIMGESLVQCFLGGVIGLIIAFILSLGLSFLQIKIPIPWDMSPNPHFLPGGGDPIFQTLSLPVTVPLSLAVFALVLSLVIGGLAGGLLSRTIAKIKPAEVLRHE